MWAYYCWEHQVWFKTAKGALWHKRRWDCEEYVERVSIGVSRELEGMTRPEVNGYQPPWSGSP